MPFTLATWNINSVRLREPIVLKLLAEHGPDVLCLQECKSPVDKIPTAAFIEAGYTHMVARGQKGYNGVAILSRLPLVDAGDQDFATLGHARHVAAKLENGVTVHNFYVPAGGDVPDREVNAKFGQKLDFLERMTRWADAIDRPTLIVGDFNIAPLESDVWNHKQLLKVVSHTPVEVESLQRFMDAHGWSDIGREHIKAPDRYYSWWSYRSKDWKTNDRGRRLDHMWASPELAKEAVGHSVHEYARDWEKPSDHVPLVTEFAL